MDSGIYLITNQVNGKVYVGKSLQLRRRLNTHKSCLKANRHINHYLQSSWNKYGEENFSFEIIERLPVQLIAKREYYWIVAFNAIDRESGYNIELPDVLQEYKKIISIANKKRSKPVSEETKKKISNTLRGHVVLPTTLEKIKHTWFQKGKEVTIETREKAKTRLSKLWLFNSPEGKPTEIINLKEFCKENKLCFTSMRKVHAQKYYNSQSYKGWSKL